MEYDVYDRIECAYKCACSREKTDAALVSLGEKELSELIDSENETVLDCGFCDKKYKYTKSELKKLLEKARKK